MKNVYLDSNMVIYFVEQNEAFFYPLKALLLNPANPVKVMYSDLLRMETTVLPLQLGDQDLLMRYDNFFTALQTPPIPMSTRVFELATQLRATHRLKTPDALHLSAAICGRCDEFWTNDHRLANAAQGKIAVVSIEKTI